MKMKSTAFGCSVTLILLVGLIGCVNVANVPKVLPSLYQPPILRLMQGQQVQTQDGPYSPPANEVWHSDARFRQLELENINLTAALAQKN